MIMLLYLDNSYKRWEGEGRMKSKTDLRGAVMEGAVQRVRPKMMTVMAILMASSYTSSPPKCRLQVHPLFGGFFPG
jgi:hypothetical protein